MFCMSGKAYFLLLAAKPTKCETIIVIYITPLNIWIDAIALACKPTGRMSLSPVPD